MTLIDSSKYDYTTALMISYFTYFAVFTVRIAYSKLGPFVLCRNVTSPTVLDSTIDGIYCMLTNPS